MADNVHISVLSRNYNSVSFDIYTRIPPIGFLRLPYSSE